jgi:hypothetical protein
MTTKSVSYAYPASPDATRFGFGKTGCYCVELHKGEEAPEAIQAFDCREKAEAYADALVHPWNALYTQWHTSVC